MILNGERTFLDTARELTVAVMASHVSHIGVHDHGFNNVSTYGNLWRLMNEGRIEQPSINADRHLVAFVAYVVHLRASRFARTGQRVFVFNDEVFPLDLATTIRRLLRQ